MTENQKRKWDDVTLKSLETQLRHLPAVEVPETLKAKLFAKIPNRTTGAARKHEVQWRPGAWGLGVAAAAVLILVLMLAPNYGPSVPSQTLIADLNDKPARNVLGDQNNTLIVDTNYTSLSGR